MNELNYFQAISRLAYLADDMETEIHGEENNDFRKTLEFIQVQVLQIHKLLSEGINNG